MSARLRWWVRAQDDPPPPAGNGTSAPVWCVVDERTGRVVFRTYNKRDAYTEAASRNKFGPPAYEAQP